MKQEWSLGESKYWQNSLDFKKALDLSFADPRPTLAQ